MTLIPEITFRDIERSPALVEAIQGHIDKLDKFHHHIMSCRVVVEFAEKHKHQGNQYRVSIDVKVPEKELVANRHVDEDFYIAMRDAFHAIERQLDDYCSMHRRK